MEDLLRAKNKKFDFVWFFYQILLIFFCFLFWPFFIKKIRKGLKQRLGLLDEGAKRLRGGKVIWAHAASVGEVVGLGNLVKAVKSECPGYHFVISTLTSTGQAMARKIIPDGRAFIYFPLDFSCIAGRILDAIKPKMCIITETELWPNFIKEAKERSIPIVMANGRISIFSFRSYRMVKFFMRKVLRNIDLFIMQSQADAERIISLGAPAARVTVAGNLKFDTASDIFLRSVNLNQESNRLFFVAGSTHRGEEEIILDVYEKVSETYPDIILILAPRHPERITEVEKLLRSKNFRFRRRTELPFPFPENDSTRIVLLDTIGELVHFYARARIVFVGGSLVPAGGHNILEPAGLGKAVFFGPYMDNFAEVAQSFISRGAGIVVSNREELLQTILKLLGNPEELEKMGRAALDIVVAHKGAAKKSAVLVKELLTLGENRFGA